ncbi:hypothetical protein [Streptomyces sp. NPDC093094]|uniref:hypothetical protein n=1 Tax=Streptomyces sp. NPDC093094 TaxID=3366026 RepID=UPI0038193568
MNGRISYRGPATIDGVLIPNVQLREKASGSGPRTWEGRSSFRVAEAPEGFGLAPGGPVAIELADGRRGDVLVRNVSFDGRRWTIDFTGTGPAPR